MRLQTLFTFAVSLFLLSGTLWTQPATLRGRVIEMRGDQAIGIANVKVVIPDYDYSYTDTEGWFSLTPPEETERIVLLLEESPFRLLSPPDGLVILPPEGDVRLTVCGAENRRLQQQVDKLNAYVRTIEKKHQLTQRQLLKLQQQLVDTVLHFQSRLQEADAVIESYEYRSDQQDRRIARLEDSVQVLVRQLAVALEARYLRQREVFGQLSAGLHRYNDEAKNLRDMLYPSRISAYFLNESARQRLYETIEDYNAARKKLLDRRSGYVSEVNHYWNRRDLTAQTERTLALALDEVHTLGIYPLEFSVMEALKQFLQGQQGRMRAQKVAQGQAETGIPVLAARIESLETAIHTTLDKLASAM